MDRALVRAPGLLAGGGCVFGVGRSWLSLMCRFRFGLGLVFFDDFAFRGFGWDWLTYDSLRILEICCVGFGI